MRRHISLLFLALSMIVILSIIANAEPEDPGITNILDNFWHNLNPFLEPNYEIDPQENADVYGWYNKTFFRLANWEREVCLQDLSSDFRNVRIIDASDQENPLIYTNTLTVTALKSRVYGNYSLYEVSYYIMPYTDDLSYRVYLANDADKVYLAGSATKWETADVYEGKSDFFPKYFDKEYKVAVLEYKIGEDPYTLSRMVVDKNVG